MFGCLRRKREGNRFWHWRERESGVREEERVSVRERMREPGAREERKRESA